MDQITKDRVNMLVDVISEVTEHDEDAKSCVLCTVMEALHGLTYTSDSDEEYWAEIEKFFREENALGETDEEFPRKWVRPPM